MNCNCARKRAGIGFFLDDVFGAIGDAGSFVVDQLGSVVNTVGGVVGLTPAVGADGAALSGLGGLTSNLGSLLGASNALYTTFTGKPLIGGGGATTQVVFTPIAGPLPPRTQTLAPIAPSVAPVAPAAPAAPAQSNNALLIGGAILAALILMK